MNIDDLDGQDWAAILVYGSVGLLLASSIPRLFRGRLLTGILALTFWIAAFATTLVAYAYRYELQSVGERVLAVVFPGTLIVSGPKEVTVFRRPDGQFELSASLETARVPFILDTGASTVVLRAEDAARLGIPVKRLTFDIPVSTANGHAMTAAIRLPVLKIGTIAEHDVDALVARPGALHANLLGMSFLNRLESFTFSNDRLVLRGR